MTDTRTHIVAFDKDGPIEVEMVGAQPTGETLIESLRGSVPIDVELVTDANSTPTPVGATESPDHTARKHHKYGPSKLGYLQACAGFTSTDGTSEAAEQGTRLHEIMDRLINAYKVTKRPLLELLSEYCADQPMDDEERSLLVSCIRTLNEWLPKATEIHNEIRVHIFNPDGSELVHGLLDILLVFGETALLIDLKFGWVPVPPAASNLQGRAYALGAFQKFHKLRKIAVMFLQPKLGGVSQAVYTRAQINEMYQSIRQVIDRAELVQNDPAGTEDLLSPSDYCAYCLHAKNGTCPAKVKQLKSAVVALHPTQAAAFMDLDKIDTPEKAAKLRHAIELLETGEFIEQAKTRAREMAIANGGEISYETPGGETIRYAVEDRRHDRSLGGALEVATTLKDQGILTFEEVLSAAELSIGKLETVGTNAIFEKNKEIEVQEVAHVERSTAAAVTAGRMTKTAAKAAVAARKKELKATKKAATEAFQKILENQGLLSRPEGTIPVLRRKKNEQKQLPAPPTPKN